jgi:hypothetical protein
VIQLRQAKFITRKSRKTSSHGIMLSARLGNSLPLRRGGLGRGWHPARCGYNPTKPTILPKKLHLSLKFPLRRPKGLLNIPDMPAVKRENANHK